MCLLAKRRRSGRERQFFIVQPNGSRGAQDCFSQPAHAEQQQQNADYELKRVQRNAIEKRAEREDDERERRKAGERAKPGRPPAADGCDREHDRQRLHGFDERTQERRRNGGGHGCPSDSHDGGRKRSAATLASGDERETDRSITFLSFFFRSGFEKHRIAADSSAARKGLSTIRQPITSATPATSWRICSMRLSIF